LRQDFQATLWIGLDWIHELMDWIGSAKMDPCPTLSRSLLRSRSADLPLPLRLRSTLFLTPADLPAPPASVFGPIRSVFRSARMPTWNGNREGDKNTENI